MTNYFRIAPDGARRGPYSKQQLQEFAASESIKPNTLIVTDAGDTIAAKQIPGLVFGGVGFGRQQSSGGFFDFGFTRFITNVLVPVIWCFVLITSFLDYGYGIMTALGIMQPIQAVEVLLFTSTRFILSILSIEHPIVAIFANTILLFLNLVVTRIILELIIVLFRIETYLRAMR